LPLKGDEIRACWEATVAPIESPVTTVRRPALAPINVVEDRTPVRRLEFVEVRSSPPRATRRTAPEKDAAADAAGPGARGETPIRVVPTEPGWSLWGDPEG
jgi:hypothetical protein